MQNERIRLNNTQRSMASADSSVIYSRTGTCMEFEVSEVEREVAEAGDDLYELGTIIGRYRINQSNRKIKSPEQARELIQEYIASFKDQQDRYSEYLESRNRGLLAFLRKEREHQLTCAQLYEDAKKELFSQNQFVVCNLQLQCTDFENIMLKRKRMLQEGSVNILITGEICAGKSSVLNMLMGGHYMAVGHGPCTQIPCEVQHSRELKAVLYYDDLRFSPRHVDISANEEDVIWSQLQHCMEKGEDVLTETDKRTAHKLKKIRIHWKLPFLEDWMATNTKGNKTDVEEDEDVVLYGVTFIDVPGIHDTEDTFVNIHEYIRSSDAFLFVINTSQHAGIDADRLLRLMSDVRNTFEKKNGMFFPSCGFFVCNKWDTVEDEVRPGLKKEVFQKLSAKWPRVPEKQIVPLSSSLQAVKCVRLGKFNEEYVQFNYSLCSFVETAARLKTELSASWLSTIVDKTIAAVQNMKDFVNLAKPKQQDILEQLRLEEDKIVATKDKITAIENSLTDFLQDKMDHLKKYLEKNLKENEQKLGTWHINSIPRHEGDDWIKTNRTITEAIGRRIEDHITKDSHVQQVLNQTNEKVDDSLNHVIKLYTELENSLVFSSQQKDGKLGDLTYLETSTGSGLSWQEIAGVVVAVVFPLAPIVVLIVDAIDQMMTSSLLDDQNKFRESCYDYMSCQTSIFLEQVIKSKLPQVSEALLDTHFKNSRFVFQYFFHCLKIRHQMTLELTKEMKLKTPAHSTRDLKKLSDKLQKFLVGDILRPEVDERLIRYDPQKDCLGSGTFGQVYKGSYIHARDTEITPVAVKVIKLPRGSGRYPEDSYFIRECFMLRMLSVKPAAQRTHVVEYLGHFSEISPEDYKLVLVFELCDSNLDALIKNKKLMVPGVPYGDVDFPGQDNTGTKGVAFVLLLTEQAATGVRFLHDYNIIHRDIKPHNFLIKYSETNAVIKVCDFGLSRQEDMAKTVSGIGTVLYNAPEILAHKPHTFASDIYSLGLVFWELWYGVRVFEDLPDNEIRNSNRKPPEMRNVAPLEKYRALLVQMFKTKPEQRPNIDTVVRTLKDVRQKFRREEI